jgi:hypothetical protein
MPADRSPARRTPEPAEPSPGKSPRARTAAFGLRTAALAGMLAASTALPGALSATGLAGVFSGEDSVLAYPLFPTCCGTDDV